jgi:outer membrane biosynthesis protein TonB
MIAAAEQPVNIKAAAWTIGVHIALLLLFLLFRYSLPVQQPVQELGMEVNLGSSLNGSGDDQPMATEQPAPDAASVSFKSAAQQTTAAKEMEESNDPDAPAINQPNHSHATTHANTMTETRTRHSNQPNTESNSPRQQRPRYTYNGSTGTGGNGAMQDHPGTNEGNTTGPGDRGVPNGTPGAANYEGSPGNGNGGINHNLTGRSIVAFPPREADFKEGGRVVIKVTVNREGVITEKRIVSISNAALRDIALRKVEKIRFNKSDSAPAEQFGNITFVFKTRS